MDREKMLCGSHEVAHTIWKCFAVFCGSRKHFVGMPQRILHKPASNS